MLAILAESALRSLLLGSVVWIGLNLLRVRNPHVHMTSWVMVLVASLSMPLLMHWTTVSITLDALPVPAPEPVARQESVAGATALVAAIGARHARRSSWRELPSCQLADRRDGNLRIRCRDAVA